MYSKLNCKVYKVGGKNWSTPQLSPQLLLYHQTTMLLINYTRDKFISVKDVTGTTIQVDPGQKVEVPDVDAISYLANYAHIFKKVEDIVNVNYIQKITQLEVEIRTRDNRILKLIAENDALKAKLVSEWVELDQAIVEGAEIVAAEEEASEIEKLQAEYKAVTKKDAPKNKKNDAEWLKAKIAEATK